MKNSNILIVMELNPVRIYIYRREPAHLIFQFEI